MTISISNFFNNTITGQSGSADVGIYLYTNQDINYWNISSNYISHNYYGITFSEQGQENRVENNVLINNSYGLYFGINAKNNTIPVIRVAEAKAINIALNQNRLIRAK